MISHNLTENCLPTQLEDRRQRQEKPVNIFSFISIRLRKSVLAKSKFYKKDQTTKPKSYV